MGNSGLMDGHSLALMDNGTVWAWGDGDTLGNGDSDFNQPTAVQVPGLSGVTAIASGDGHNLAATSTTVYAWGSNTGGELGNGTVGDDIGSSPQPVKQPPEVWPAGSTVVAVAAGGQHSLAVIKTQDGEVWVLGWGRSDSGEVGDGTYGNNHYIPVPVRADLRNVAGTITGIATGESHSLAIDSTGTLYSWGMNLFGELGTGDDNDGYLPAPVRMDHLAGITFTEVAAGDHHSLAR